MFLSRVEIENFRIFGDKKSGESLDLPLSRGLNVLVGENDSGKTAVLDALRLLLGTQSNDWLRITKDDFHVEGGTRADEIHIACEFSDLDEGEAAVFLEWLSISEANASKGLTQWSLRIWLDAMLRDSPIADRDVQVRILGGVAGNGIPLEGEARQILRPTYLKPLRDAVQELAAKRASRLSQILYAYRAIRAQDTTVQQTQGAGHQKTLVDIVREANRGIETHPSVVSATDSLNNRYLQNFTLGEDKLRGVIRIADPELRRILEQLQLTLAENNTPQTETVSHGLGVNNLLFMATELLLLQNVGKETANPLLLVEEPEAHLHPQLQVRLCEFLDSCGAQVIVTTHSPNLASAVDIERLVIMREGKCFPLAAEYTQLDVSDYRFLRRFLDVTRANLFFARGVLIVEGPAEQILLPTIAKVVGRPLTKHGVSVVMVGHTGLFRYAKIFQRKFSPDIGIRVACVSDRDIPPDCAKPYLSPRVRTEFDYAPDQVKQRIENRKKVEGGPVKSYVSPRWTLEYDLALTDLRPYVNRAIRLAAEVDTKGYDSKDRKQTEVMAKADEVLYNLQGSGLTAEQIALEIYRPLLDNVSKAEAAQFLAAILEEESEKPGKNEAISASVPDYLRRAINYVTRLDPSTGVGPNDI